MENKDYRVYLRNEYRRLKKNSKVRSNDAYALNDMDDLLAKISKMKSPEKEQAFVEGIMHLCHIPSIAA
jgi:hypothetical protein